MMFKIARRTLLLVLISALAVSSVTLAERLRGDNGDGDRVLLQSARGQKPPSPGPPLKRALQPRPPSPKLPQPQPQPPSPKLPQPQPPSPKLPQPQPPSRKLPQPQPPSPKLPQPQPPSPKLTQPQPPSPKPRRDSRPDMVTRLKGTANNLGLDFLVSFAEAALPAARDVLDDLPPAANYIYRLLERGLNPRLADPNGPVATAMYDILQTFFSRTVTTTSGSIVADYILYKHNIDVGALAGSGDMASLVAGIRRSRWYPPWWWWGYDATRGAQEVLSTVSSVVQTLAQQAMSPWGHLHPVTLASESVDLLAALADRTVAHAESLRSNTDAAVQMTEDEYDTFVRLQSNLGELRRSLMELSGDLDEQEEKHQISSPPPPSPRPPPGPPSPPSPPPYRMPPWVPWAPWTPSWPSWPESPRPGSVIGLVIRNLAEKLGVSFVLTFLEDATSALDDISVYSPAAADYLYKLFARGLGSDLSNEDGAAAYALYDIVRDAIRTWPSTPTGSIVADSILSNHNINLYSLGAARNFREMVNVFKEAVWGRYIFDESDGPSYVIGSVGEIIASLVHETTTLDGRLDPLQLVQDIVDFAYTTMNSVVANSDPLRFRAQVSLTMTDDEYQAFSGLKGSFGALRDALRDLQSNLPAVSHAPLPPYSLNHPPVPWSWIRPTPAPSNQHHWGEPVDTSAPPKYPEYPPYMPMDPLRPGSSTLGQSIGVPPPVSYTQPPSAQPLPPSPPYSLNHPPVPWSWIRPTPAPSNQHHWGEPVNTSAPPKYPEYPPYMPMDPLRPGSSTLGQSIGVPPPVSYTQPPSAQPKPPLPPSVDNQTDDMLFWPWWWSTPPPQSKKTGSSVLDGVLELLRSTADKLGVNFLIQFFESSTPAVADIVKDAPIAANYTYKLLQAGLGPYLSDSNGPAADSLYRIMQAAFNSLVYSPTGSVIVDIALLNHQFDLGALVGARSFADVISILKATPSFGGVNASTAVDIVGSVTQAIEELVWDVLNPSGRLVPIQLARDVVDFSLAVVSATVDNAGKLRNNADAALSMSDEEYSAFQRMQRNFGALRDALRDLQSNLPVEDLFLQYDPNDYNKSFPPFTSVWGTELGPHGARRALSWEDYTSPKYPGYPPYPPFFPSWPRPSTLGQSIGVPPPVSYTQPPSAQPKPPLPPSVDNQTDDMLFWPWWWSTPPPQSKKTGSSVLDGVLELLRSTADKLGVNFLIQFFESSTPAVADIVKDAPIAANYTYKLLQAGLGPYLSDSNGPAADSLYRIMQAAFNSLASTPSGGVVVNIASRNHHVMIGALARTHNFSHLISVLKTNQSDYGSVADRYTAAEIVHSVMEAVRVLMWYAVNPSGGLGPIQLARDVVDFSLAVVSATVDNAGKLRNNADAALSMSDEEYSAFQRMQRNLERLRSSLLELSGSLDGSNDGPDHHSTTPSPQQSPLLSPTWQPPRHVITPPRQPFHDGLHLLRNTANSLGLDFLVAFTQSAYPAVRDVLEDLPITANYVYKLLKHGLDPYQPTYPEYTFFPYRVPSVGDVLYGILHSTFQTALYTDTGSIVADYLLQNNLDLTQLVNARNFTELLGTLKDAYWWPSFYDYYFKLYGDGDGTTAQRGAVLIVDNVANAVQTLVRDAVLPAGRLTPHGLASDVVDIAHSLVHEVAYNSWTLRNAADHELQMGEEEYHAFYRLEANLWIIHDALLNLRGSLLY
ncbi:hypothetical protein VaNZ11_014470 [Volvox africanus]|uniref:Uncharacterized protein n=1 Tax=Volvox africanus TaxID=51714 RepID=A0ABQ5SII2_9CHLO|nr:hypothetical protein VaNZ11_014470 [Volvox africanus]